MSSRGETNLPHNPLQLLSQVLNNRGSVVAVESLVLDGDRERHRRRDQHILVFVRVHGLAQRSSCTNVVVAASGHGGRVSEVHIELCGSSYLGGAEDEMADPLAALTFDAGGGGGVVCRSICWRDGDRRRGDGSRRGWSGGEGGGAVERVDAANNEAAEVGGGAVLKRQWHLGVFVAVLPD